MEYVEGWYDEERDPSENFYHWRWTKRKAVLRTSSPEADSILYLRAESDQSWFPQPQKVILRWRGVILDEFLVPGSEEFEKKYHLRKDQLGPGPMVDLELNVDQTFIPASKGNSSDRRELGLRVFNLYLTRASE
jgi:hypothetical protein